VKDFRKEVELREEHRHIWMFSAMIQQLWTVTFDVFNSRLLTTMCGIIRLSRGPLRAARASVRSLQVNEISGE
jgi:hypothetical protein